MPFWNQIYGENSVFLIINFVYKEYEAKKMEQIPYIEGAKKGTLSIAYVSTDKVSSSSQD